MLGLHVRGWTLSHRQGRGGCNSVCSCVSILAASSRLGAYFPAHSTSRASKTEKPCPVPCAQDGVPACLQDLSQAGIKVWVLTGDKVETAISIAYSCNLFNNDMEVLEFREADFVRGKESGWDKLKVSSPASNSSHLVNHSNISKYWFTLEEVTSMLTVPQSWLQFFAMSGSTDMI